MKVLWPLANPASWMALLLILAALAPWLRRRTPLERVLAALPLLLFALLAMPPLAELSVRALVLPESARAAPAGAGELLVVLGGGMDERGRLSGASYARTAGAVTMWQRKVAPVVLFSGVEAPHMAALARTLGMPAEAQLIEDRSRSTRENAVFTGELLASPTDAASSARQPAGQNRVTLPRIVLVTSPEHLRRAVGSFRAVGFQVVPGPAPYPHQPEAMSPWPSFHRAAVLAQVLYERAALVAYRARGWM